MGIVREERGRAPECELEFAWALGADVVAWVVELVANGAEEVGTNGLGGATARELAKEGLEEDARVDGVGALLGANVDVAMAEYDFVGDESSSVSKEVAEGDDVARDMDERGEDESSSPK